jgi:large subunit ribosomal protein L9
MKVILLKDIAKLGRKNDVKNVSDGHALNLLIPQGLVEVATPKALQRIEILKKREVEEKKIRTDLLLKNFGDLKGITIEIQKPANEQGHLFAQIHKDEIIQAVKEQTRLDVETEYLETKDNEPIKTAGEHEIEVKVGERSIKFTLVVKNQGEPEKTEKNKEKTSKPKTSKSKKK